MIQKSWTAKLEAAEEALNQVVLAQEHIEAATVHAHKAEFTGWEMVEHDLSMATQWVQAACLRLKQETGT